ncbi:MAG TPA: FAD-dependent monooxygenase [Hansschlegelia sp.]
MPARALIAGAGIGGLTLALALARRGVPSQIVERAASLEETGAGVQLSPNAGRILDALGLGQALDAAATRPEAVTIADALSARTLKTLPLGADAERRWGAPYRVVHRSDLQTILLEATRGETGVELTLGAEILSARETTFGAAVEIAKDGAAEMIEGGWLAGADGLRSVVRRAVKLPATVQATGLRAWRTVLPAGALPEAFGIRRVSVWLGPGAHLVVYPVRGGREANLVLIGDDRIETPADLVVGWAAPARDAVAACSSWTPWPLHDRAPDARMRHGRIALIGDAAHATLPSLAQGAAFAIEDAATLARLVAEGGPDAFGAYERARLMRCAKLQMRSRRQIRIDHLAGLAARARNLALAATPASVLLGGLDWIYGWRDG